MALHLTICTILHMAIALLYFHFYYVVALGLPLISRSILVNSINPEDFGVCSLPESICTNGFGDM
jgi:hypothetical protein